MTLPGKEAYFLAGGRFPFPAVQGGGASNAIGIQFEEFGVRLRFTPYITRSGAIRLKLIPKVSALDFANGLVISGFTIPSITARRAETEVELREGQYLAIAGLLDNSVTDNVGKIPFLEDIRSWGSCSAPRTCNRNEPSCWCWFARSSWSRRVSPTSFPRGSRVPGPGPKRCRSLRPGPSRPRHRSHNSSSHHRSSNRRSRRAGPRRTYATGVEGVGPARRHRGVRGRRGWPRCSGMVSLAVDMGMLMKLRTGRARAADAAALAGAQEFRDRGNAGHAR